jgi:hypothetical protein
MSRTAQVMSSTRVHDEDGHGVDVTVDPGGGDLTTVSHFASSGDDAPPLGVDFTALTDASGTGSENAVGYADVLNAGKAAPGEKRIYARDAEGVVKADLWLKGDGTIIATNAGGTITLSPDGVLHVAGSSDAAALASKIDKIGRPISAIAAAVTPADVLAAVNAIVSAFKLSYPTVGPVPSIASVGSQKLKVSG